MVTTQTVVRNTGQCFEVFDLANYQWVGRRWFDAVVVSAYCATSRVPGLNNNKNKNKFGLDIDFLT